MTSVEIGFRAFDPHELLCHFVAQDQGYYREEGLDPRLTDLTFVQPAPTGIFHVACGAALLGRLGGEPYRVLLAAARGPMFKLVGRGSPTPVEALRGSVVASFPAGSPPDLFLRLFLHRAGLTPDTDVIFRAVRDDLARLGLLASGDAGAALVSSAIPNSVLQTADFGEIANLATELPIPTSGLAIHESLNREVPSLVESMVRVHRRSLEAIQNLPRAVGGALIKWFHVADGNIEDTVRDLQPMFSSSGRLSKAEAELAISLVATETRAEHSFGWNDLYATDRP